MFIKPKLSIEDFDYTLPDAQIAYKPAANRAGSKLLIWDKELVAETNYSNIAKHIPANASLLLNNSKVIAARIWFEKSNTLTANTKSTIEIFCLEPTAKYTPVVLAMQAKQKVEWTCLVGGAKKWKEESLSKQVKIQNDNIEIIAKKINQAEGKFTIEFSWDHPDYTFSEILTAIGNIPLPPYIQRAATEEDKDRYQTTYAIEEGSVAAPTAGLHFSKEVFDSLNEKNIQQKYLTLHVGAGTFMPVKAATIDEHNMHAEFIEVDLDLIQYLSQHAGDANHPIIAVGTTSLRTIESLYWLGVKANHYEQIHQQVLPIQKMYLGQWEAYELNTATLTLQESMQALIQWLAKHNTRKLIAKTQLMVTPGYSFKICDALVTNFHQPKSTLLLIIAAIVGDAWKAIYAHALAHEYRFLSYGDGCLFWIKPQVK